MDNRNTRPAVEPPHQEPPPAVESQYEDPPPREQTIWNFGIYTTVAIVAAIFVVVVLIAIFAF